MPPAGEATESAAAAGPELEYDTSEMSDGVNMSPRAADPSAQAAAAASGQRKFTATNSHREQVMRQMAGLKRKQSLNTDPWD
jgi:hypothetical protein